MHICVCVTYRYIHICIHVYVCIDRYVYACVYIYRDYVLCVYVLIGVCVYRCSSGRLAKLGDFGALACRVSRATLSSTHRSTAPARMPLWNPGAGIKSKQQRCPASNVLSAEGSWT